MKRIAFSGLVLASAALIFAGCSVASEYEDTVQGKMIAQYDFETGSGTTVANDADTAGLTMTLSSAVTFVTGKVGSWAINVPTDVLGNTTFGTYCGTITTTGGLVSTDVTGITISAFVKGSSAWSNLMGFWNNTSNRVSLNLMNMYSNINGIEYVCYPTNASFSTGLQNGATETQFVTGGAAVGTDGYSQIIVSIDSSTDTISYYANGVLVISYSIGMSTVIDNILTSCRSGTVLVGQVYADPAVVIDDLRIYNTAYTAAEALTLYNSLK